MIIGFWGWISAIVAIAVTSLICGIAGAIIVALFTGRINLTYLIAEPADPQAQLNAQAMGLLTPDGLAGLLRELNHLATSFSIDGRPLPLITPPSLRIGVRRLIEPVLPALPVVSLAELPPSVTLQSAGVWEMPHA